MYIYIRHVKQFSIQPEFHKDILELSRNHCHGNIKVVRESKYIHYI